MSEDIKVLGIAGSLRQASFNKSALRASAALAPPGMAIDVFDIAPIPPFNQDDEQQPAPAVREFKARIRAADAILFCTPEYNYSIPGVLKNAIDAASRPYGDSAWNGKPAAIMGASPGALGTARAQYHLRQCFIFLNMPVVLQPEVMIAEAHARFDAQGNLTHEPTRAKIRELLSALRELTLRVRHGQAPAAAGRG